jgi:DNA-directed RNA polymerase specialized sigma24 family protein
LFSSLGITFNETVPRKNQTNKKNSACAVGRLAMKAQGHNNLSAIPGLEGVPDLAPDLVWLLGNDKAEVESLAKALIREYQKPLSLLAKAYLDGHAATAGIVQEIFLQALIKAHCFGNKQDIDAWFYQLAVKNLFKARKQLQIQKGLQIKTYRLTQEKPQNNLEGGLLSEFDRLGGRSRMTLLLRALFGWGINDIAIVLGEEPRCTQKRIEKAVKHTLHPSRRIGISTENLPAEQAVVKLEQALNRHWLDGPASPTEIEINYQLVLHECKKLTRRKWIVAHLRQGVILGLILALIMVIMLATRWLDPSVKIRQMINPPKPVPTLEPLIYYSVNEGDRLEDVEAWLHIPPERLTEANLQSDLDPPSGEAIFLPTLEEDWLEPSPTLLPPNTLPPKPLSARSTIQEVLSRMHASPNLWRTAWLDVYSLNLGPAGYAGPPRQDHFQLWASQPGKLFVISGYSYSNKVNKQLIREGLLFNISYPIILVQREAVDAVDPFSDWLFKLLDSSYFNHPEDWAILSTDKMAGRPTLVLNWMPMREDEQIWKTVFMRFWIDTVTGLPFRQQIYIRGDPPTLTMDIIVKNAMIDVDFPASIFDPWKVGKRGFASDYLATPAQPEELKAQTQEMIQLANVYGHEQYEWQPPPKGYNPSKARLTFQFPKEINLAEIEGKRVGLFADKYFLAELPYFDPWNVHCTRSADGWKIALINPLKGQQTGIQIQGGWMDLAYPEKFHEFGIGQQGNGMSFSPNNRYLAYTMTENSAYGRVVILDTETGESRIFDKIQPAFIMSWSPDSRYLAVIANQKQVFILIVLDVQKDLIAYRATIPRDTTGQPHNWPYKNWPWKDWKPELNETLKGLDGCYLP